MKIQTVTKTLADTIAQRKELEAKEKALKHELQAMLKKDGRDKEETEYGVFTIARRSYWEYPEYTDDAISQLKSEIISLQEQAQIEGTAVENVTEYVLFKEAKQ